MWGWIYVEIDERSSSAILRKMISMLQKEIESATSWRPVRRSNYWATNTQMARLGVSSTYTCDLRGTHYIWIMIDTILDLEMWAWIYVEIDERSASSILRKTIFVVRSPIRGSEIVILSMEVDDRSSTSTYIQAHISKSKIASIIINI